MYNDYEQPTLATRMARRLLWIGLFSGISFMANMVDWNTIDSARARTKAPGNQAAQTATQPATIMQERPVTVPQEPVSTVNYELPALGQIPETVRKIKADAAAGKGEDAAVLRAWAAHLQRLYKAYTNTIFLWRAD